jgi:transcriptional regulator with XRE-family HTH domain
MRIEQGNFSETLKEIRKLSELKQKEVSSLGVSPNCYASWEQGRTEPSISSIRKLCVIFDVSADYLLGIKDI